MTVSATPQDSSLTADESRLTFPVIAEKVTVHKTLADNGGLRLRKVVHEDVVEVDEELTSEAVKLTRVPIDREVCGPVEVRYEDGVTIIPIVEERLVIRRQRVLVEEIHLSRTSHTKRAPQSVTVRREEIIAERQDPGSATWRLIDPGVSDE
ncbi:MAG TPA: DUF2382 domain-containing protein [Steroidobacteraceae bacterium]